MAFNVTLAVVGLQLRYVLLCVLKTQPCLHTGGTAPLLSAASSMTPAAIVYGCVGPRLQHQPLKADLGLKRKGKALPAVCAAQEPSACIRLQHLQLSVALLLHVITGALQAAHA